MPITLSDRPEISAGATRIIAIDYQDDLMSGELLSGSPTVAEQTSSDLTIANAAVNTGALTIKGRAVAIGQAVQFKVSGQQASTEYTVRVTVATDSTPAQTFVYDIVFDCV